MDQLPRAIQAVAPWVERYGYAAIGVGVMLEDFGVPVPGETLLVAGAVFAGLGRLDIAWVVAVAFAGAVVGDNIGYLIGRFGGRRLVLRYGRYAFITVKRLARVEAFFARHGGKVVAVARFIDVLRQLNGVVAGIARMDWRRFLVFNAVGAALWVGVWATAGHLAGRRLDVIWPVLVRYQRYVLIAAGAALAAAIAYVVIRHRRRA